MLCAHGKKLFNVELFTNTWKLVETKLIEMNERRKKNMNRYILQAINLKRKWRNFVIYFMHNFYHAKRSYRLHTYIHKELRPRT